jgi:hypothetical protein
VPDVRPTLGHWNPALQFVHDPDADDDAKRPAGHAVHGTPPPGVN